MNTIPKPYGQKVKRLEYNKDIGEYRFFFVSESMLPIACNNLEVNPELKEYYDYAVENNLVVKTDEETLKPLILQTEKTKKINEFDTKLKHIINNGNPIILKIEMGNGTAIKMPTTILSLSNIITQGLATSEKLFEFNSINNQYRFKINQNDTVESREILLQSIQNKINLFLRKAGEISLLFQYQVDNAKTVKELNIISDDIWDFDNNRNDYGWGVVNNIPQLVVNVGANIGIDIFKCSGSGVLQPLSTEERSLVIQSLS